MVRDHQAYRVGQGRVVFRMGDITTSSAHAIVSAASTDLDMSGGVSQAISLTAGDSVLQEIQAFRDDDRNVDSIGVGRVVPTGGGMLAEYVFHAITKTGQEQLGGKAPPVSEDPEAEVVKDLLRSSFRLVRRHRISSIAFPVLGGGAAGMDKLMVAAAMGAEIKEQLEALSHPAEVEVWTLPRDFDAFAGGRLEWFRRFQEAAGLEDAVIKDHAVLLVHGINTRARWFQSLERTLNSADNQLYTSKSGYGLYGVVRFLFPFRWMWYRSAAKIASNIRYLQRRQDTSSISIIAHSFGSFLVGKVLEENRDLEIDHVILCGAVLPAGFDWNRLDQQIATFADGKSPNTLVLNDVGVRDILPVIARSVTWGYGDSGTYGFQSSSVQDRFHEKKNHSGFFEDPGFIEEYWLKALTDGEITVPPGNPSSPPMRKALRWILDRIRIKYLVLAPVAFALANALS